MSATPDEPTNTDLTREDREDRITAAVEQAQRARAAVLDDRQDRTG